MQVTKRFRMLIGLVALVGVLALPISCKKAIREVQESFVLDVMTSGTWLVVRLQSGSTNESSLFANYEFQFYRNRTVDALRNGVKVHTGTWDANEVARTITSNFTAGTDPVVVKLNGIWNITSVGFTTVKSNQTISGDNWQLDLRKK